MQLVGHDDVERARLGGGQLGEVLLLARLPRPLAAPVVLRLQRVLGDGQRHRPELLGDLALQHGPPVGPAFLQHVVQDARDDGHLLAPVARQDDRDTGGVGHVVHPGAGRSEGVVVLGRERKGVGDAVGVSVHDVTVRECRAAYASAG